MGFRGLGFKVWGLGCRVGHGLWDKELIFSLAIAVKGVGYGLWDKGFIGISLQSLELRPRM